MTITEREAVKRICGLLELFVVGWKTNQLKGRFYGKKPGLWGARQAPR
ncbi:MAG: hypothetical protein AB1Z20_13600 [Desulfobacterales bacterium]